MKRAAYRQYFEALALFAKTQTGKVHALNFAGELPGNGNTRYH